MHPEARKFKQVAEKHLRGRKGSAARYTPALKTRAVKFALKRRSEGIPFRKAAGMIGISENSLSRWIKEAGRPIFKPVDIVEGIEDRKEAQRPVLVTPQGFRIEGLEIGDLAALLRALL